MAPSNSSNTPLSGASDQKICLTDSLVLDYMRKVTAPKLVRTTTGLAVCGPSDDVKSEMVRSVPSTDSSSADVKGAIKLSALKNTMSKLTGATAFSPTGKIAMKPVKFVLPVSFSAVNTSASLCAGVYKVDVTNSSEWSSLSALYDEYRFLEGKLAFMICTPTTIGAVPTDSMPVLCFDPVDATALTGVRNGCEFAQHKLYACPNVSGNGGSVTDGKPLIFRWRCGPATNALSIDNTGLVSSTPGAWKKLPVAGSNYAYDGSIKTYWTNSAANGAAAIAGILYLTVEFRCRQ